MLIVCETMNSNVNGFASLKYQIMMNNEQGKPWKKLPQKHHTRSVYSSYR